MSLQGNFPIVLDLGFGRGGDLKKYAKQNPSSLTGVGMPFLLWLFLQHLSLADISSVSLENAISRYNAERCTFPMELIHADFTQVRLPADVWRC